MPTRDFTGGCLCGAVTYTASGEPRRFYHCHCRRCRKATGTGHASNLFIKGTLTFHSGEDRIAWFKVPDAKHFSNTFCRDCGSRRPRVNAEAGSVMIPAGSLDDEPGFSVQARIFSDSRAAWSCDETALPTFPEYPVSP